MYRILFTDQWNDKQCIDFKKSFGDHFHQGFVTKVDLEAKKIFIGDGEESPLEFTDLVFAVGKKHALKITVDQKIKKSPGLKKLVKSNKTISRNIFYQNSFFAISKMAKFNF